MNDLIPQDIRIARHERIRPREWRDSDQVTRTDDTGIIATLRAQLDRAERYIEFVQIENRQLREALTQCQEAHDGL